MMRIQSRLRRLAEQLTGTRIFHHLPQGADLFVDLKKLLPQFAPRTIFDVGANVGQSAVEFAAHYPQSEVFCFEPIGATFAELQRNVRHLPGVRCFQLALGATAGTATMQTHALSVLNTLIDNPPPETERANHTEQVRIERLDDFCREHRADRIGLLKIDTEGHDMKVLEGGAGLLAARRIDLVQVEAGMNPDNQQHVALRQWLDFFEPRGYRLFGLYDQMYEWPANQPHLRRCNPVFLSADFVGGVS